MGQLDIYGNDRDNVLVAAAIGRLQFAAEQARARDLEKLYLCFSGGKDSVVIYRLAEMAGVSFEAHYNVTGIDPPELVYFIRQQYPDVIHDMYKKSIWQLIVANRMPPTRLMRYCCRELKEHGGEGSMCVTGVRHAESVRRKNGRAAYEIMGKNKNEKMLFNDNSDSRRWFEQCDMKKKMICNPIIDWTDEDVWGFIHRENVPYCELYDEGFNRLGCIGCPQAPPRIRKKEFERWPKFKQLYINAFDKMLAKKTSTEWKTGEDVFNWWLAGKFDKKLEGQISIM